ncbi:MAG TPA: M1 family metallopeptidase [Kofleriaceae bacterium]|jgi:alanyl aminopeptidase
MPRVLALIAAALAACSEPHVAQQLPPKVAPTRDARADAIAAPGLRLPPGVTPLAYNLRLEVDPNAEDFTGHVAIRVRVDAPTDHVWIHADELDIRSASWTDGPLSTIAVPGDQMIAFGFGRRVAPGEVTLTFDYVGHTAHDQEGLFRQSSDDRWYMFSQGESTLARRIVPCFDEPGFKTPWRVTIVSPARDVALSNMPQTAERVLPDGRREIAFAETPAMPSYLLAIAVGPFALVDAGTVGRAHVPVRVAALAGQATEVGVVAKHLPAIVAALETYTDDALPWPKLDLVVVPKLFGAMENPGLVTFAEHLIVGDPPGEFVRVAAHELAHFWFGDLVTHAWWNDLWLAEAFASWLGDRTAASLGAGSPVDDALARRRALEADALATAVPLRRLVTSNDDPDNSFDDTEYDKGKAVLATFEHWVGDAVFRTAVLAYLRDHRGATATTEDFTRALGAAGGPEIAAAFVGYVDHAGVPVLDLELDCASGAAKLVAHARDHLAIPACFRVARDGAPACALVGEHTELPLASCPAWAQSTGGYYVVAWRGTRPPDPPRAQLSISQRAQLGEDIELAVRRGELAPTAALPELRSLAGPELGAAVSAAAIARAIDPLVADDDRPVWRRWLAARFAARLQPAMLLESGELAGQLADQLIELVGADRLPASIRNAARDRATRDIARGITPDSSVVAAAAGDRALFDRIAALASRDPDWTPDPLEMFGPELAPAAVELALGPLPSAQSVAVVSAYLHRATTRAAMWAALRPKIPALLAHIEASDAVTLLDATGALCSATLRAEVSAAFEPELAHIPDGRDHLDRALATIDLCIAARARAADLAAALR